MVCQPHVWGHVCPLPDRRRHTPLFLALAIATSHSCGPQGSGQVTYHMKGQPHPHKLLAATATLAWQPATATAAGPAAPGGTHTAWDPRCGTALSCWDPPSPPLQPSLPAAGGRHQQAAVGALPCCPASGSAHGPAFPGGGMAGEKQQQQQQQQQQQRRSKEHTPGGAWLPP